MLEKNEQTLDTGFVIGPRRHAINRASTGFCYQIIPNSANYCNCRNRNSRL